MRFTARMWRRRNVTERVAQPNPRVSRMNGMPRPSEYASPSSAPRAAEPPSNDMPRMTASVGPMHGVQPMPSAMPSSGAPMSPRLPRTCGRMVRCAMPEDADEDEPEGDDHDAEHARDDVGVLDEEPAEGAAEHRDAHEDERESGDEQHDAEQQPAAGRRVDRERRRRRPSCCGLEPSALAVAEPSLRPELAELGRRARRHRSADESEVAGHEREHARREERDEPCQHGDRDREQQRAVRDDARRVHSSPSASRTRDVSTDASGSWPMIRAATRPLPSSTRVVGVALMGVRSANASLTAPSSAAIRLG